MKTHPLVKYIEEARHHGMDNQQIVHALLNAGWHVHDVMNIVLDHNHFNASHAATNNEHIISVQHISKFYDQVKALEDITLSVKQGSVTALLGPNGAGKTTLVRILTTLLAPDGGQASVAGFDVVREPQQLRAVMGLAGQYAAVDETLTGRENLEMVAQLYHFNTETSRQRASELLHQFDLEDAGDRPLKTYSGGMRRRLDLAASLVAKPKVLFLDEPTSGLDPRSRFVLWNIIRDLVAAGTTVLLTTQYLEEADQLADQIFVIDHGHIIAQGTPDELKKQVGGDVLELHVQNHGHAVIAAQAIGPFGTEEPRANSDTGIVTMPVKSDASVLIDVVRQLDAMKIKILDIVMRRPSLDDVFMSLTGHTAE